MLRDETQGAETEKGSEEAKRLRLLLFISTFWQQINHQNTVVSQYMHYHTMGKKTLFFYLLIQFLNTFFKDSFCQKALSPGQSSVKYIVLVVQATPFTGLRD